MTLPDIIDYLRGTAANLDAIVADDPDGDIYTEACEAAEHATALRKIADSLAASKAESEKLQQELAAHVHDALIAEYGYHIPTEFFERVLSGGV